MQLAVLGIFMQSIQFDRQINNLKMQSVDNETRHEWQRFFDVAQLLQQENSSIVFNLNLEQLMGDNRNDFWRYEGSLTTPPCTEGIIWTIFKQPILFVESEFQSFRQNIYFEDYRRPQPLHQRVIYRNFLNETYSSILDYQCCPNKYNSTIDTNRTWSINSFSYTFYEFLLILMFICKSIEQ
jgi:carbonic anhydrase